MELTIKRGVLCIMMVGMCQLTHTMEAPPAPSKEKRERSGSDDEQLPKKNKQDTFVTEEPAKKIATQTNMDEILLAIQSGDTAKFKRLIAQRKKFLVTDIPKMFVLACACGYLDIVKFLWNEYQTWCMRDVGIAFLRSFEKTKNLAAGITEQITGFLAACYYQHPTLVNFFLEKKYDTELDTLTVNKEKLLCYEIAINLDNSDMLRALLFHALTKAGKSYLFARLIEHCVKTNRPACIDFLFQVGDFIKWQNQTLNVQTVARHNNETFTVIRSGLAARPQLQLWDNRQVLLGAAAGGHLALAQESLVQVVDNATRVAAFDLACRNGHVDIVRLLVEAGVDKNIPLVWRGRLGQQEQFRPVELALLKGHVAVANYLLENDARPKSIIGLHVLKEAVTGRLLTEDELIKMSSTLLRDGFLPVNLETLRSLCPTEWLLDVNKAFKALTQEINQLTNLVFAACRTGNLASLQENAQKIDVNMQEAGTGKTPLMVAIESNQPEVVIYLLGKGAILGRKKESGEFGVHFSREAMDAFCVDSKGKNAFEYILELDREAVFDALAEYYHKRPSEPFVSSALRAAVVKNNLKYVKRAMLVGASVGSGPLIFAADRGYAECLRLILEHKVDLNAIDSNGMTALMHAAAQGHLSCVELLVAKKAQVRLCDKSGKNALAHAAKYPAIVKILEQVLLTTQNDFEEIFFALLNDPCMVPEEGLNLQIQDRDGLSLLMRSILQKNDAAVEWCFKHKVNIHLADVRGCTALGHAAWVGNLALVNSLLDQGAKLTAKDARGTFMPVTRFAGSGGNLDIVQLLIAKSEENAKLFGNSDSRIHFAKAAFVGALSGRHVHVLEYLITNEPRIIRESVIFSHALEGCKSRRMLRLLFTHKEKHRTLQLLQPPAAEATQSTLVGTALKRNLFGLAACILGCDPSPAHFEQVEKALKDRPALVAKVSEALFASRDVVQRSLEFISDIEIVRLLDLLKIDLVKKYLQAPEQEVQVFISEFRSGVKKFLQAPEQTMQLLISEFESVDKKLDPAALEKDTQASHVMLASIAEIEKDTQPSALMLACIFGHLDVAKALTRIGLPQAYFNMRDRSGRTALMYALLYGNTDCALALISSPHDALGNVVLEGGVNLCGDGIHLLDVQQKSALFYAIFAATYDEAAVIVHQNQTTEPLTKDQYSGRLGANKLIDVLLHLKAKFTPFSLALKLAAEVADQQILFKVMSKCSVQFQTEICKNIPMAIKEK